MEGYFLCCCSVVLSRLRLACYWSALGSDLQAVLVGEGSAAISAIFLVLAACEWCPALAGLTVASKRVTLIFCDMVDVVSVQYILSNLAL